MKRMQVPAVLVGRLALAPLAASPGKDDRRVDRMLQMLRTERSKWMSVVIEPGNPLDFEQEELEQLATWIKKEHGVEIRTASRPERGYGVTFHEVIHIFVDVGGAAGGIAGGLAVLSTAVKWAQNRWRRDRDQHPGSKPRPRTITLYDSQGRPLKRLFVMKRGARCC
jgi:hypothetical protein